MGRVWALYFKFRPFWTKKKKGNRQRVDIIKDHFTSFEG